MIIKMDFCSKYAIRNFLCVLKMCYWLFNTCWANAGSPLYPRLCAFLMLALASAILLK